MTGLYHLVLILSWRHNGHDREGSEVSEWKMDMYNQRLMAMMLSVVGCEAHCGSVYV